MYSLIGVIQELVTPNITFQATDVEAVYVFWTVYACRLDRKAIFVPFVT
jgi:hypothetical protein